ncbi:MAG: hypothetical protein IT367_13575, partial [Candidatus Hydrogenedentes bacterium]|nr:hypothetical protein [Candidatus Hydrogenedentota bacterium]
RPAPGRFGSASGVLGQRAAGFQQLRLRRRKSCDGHTRSGARHIAEPDLVAEMDRGRMASMLPADADLELRIGLAPFVYGQLHQFADTLLVQHFEGIVHQDACVDVGRQELVLGILKVMAGKPVTIRLLDPPLHEFVTLTDAQISELSKQIGISPDKINARIKQLHELNPMLGHRGCRLGIAYPEITEMQARAILEASAELMKQKVKVLPEIMIPLVGHENEFKNQEAIVRRVADEVQKQYKVKIDYLVGTMIEIPRAALVANKIAEKAEFFSFGTNDLTQMGFGFSRDDIGGFLPYYLEKGILPLDPFQAIDQEGIGQLIDLGIKNGRSTRPALKVGICGEHGGEASSVKFCHRVGMNYVSCSPFRVPIARFAAAQAAIESPRDTKKAKASGKGKKK